MPTPLRARRFKPLLALVVLAVLTILYLTSSARMTQSSDFYQRTSDALAQREADEAAASAGDALSSDRNVAARLKEAEERAKASADKKGDEHRARLGMEAIPEDKESGDKSVAGRKTMSKGGLVLDEDDDDDYTAAYSGLDLGDHLDDDDLVAPAGKDQVPVKGKEQTAETREEQRVEDELNSILKRSPIIIFSKTYCPFSKKAKRILLSQYKITPAPYVVELDEHPLGAALQQALASSTGRKTVPNVLINGKSIGGGDEVQALHERGALASTVRDMGGKRIMEASLVEPEDRRRRVKR